MKRPLTARHPILLLTGLLAACSTGPKPLEEHRANAAESWAEVAHQPDRTVVNLRWDDAVRRLETGNLKLQQARETVRSGAEAVRQVPYNYIPELSLNLFAYPTLSTVGEGRLGDTYLFLGSILTLPNPVRYQAEALQARLQFMTAQVECELLRRDLRVRLYRVFRKSSQLARDDAAEHALTELAATNPDGLAAVQARDLARRNRAAWQAIESEFAELLGDYSHRWRPAPDSGLPALDYAGTPPPLDGRGRFAQLQITRTALQLLALDAQRQGLLVAEWPQVSVLLSAPPIYQRSAGRESYLSLGDVRVSGYISYSTDFRGTRALARKQNDRRSEIVRHELDVAMQAAIGRLRDGLGILGELTTRLAGLREAEAALRRAGAAGDAESVRLQAAEISDQVDELNFSFWVLDDPRWPASS